MFQWDNSIHKTDEIILSHVTVCNQTWPSCKHVLYHHMWKSILNNRNLIVLSHCPIHGHYISNFIRYDMSYINYFVLRNIPSATSRGSIWSWHVNIHTKLEARRERRPPWRQIIISILPTVKMLSLGGERLPPHTHTHPPTHPPPPKKKRRKVLDRHLHHDLGMLRLLWCFFAHLLISEYPDHHQNLISSSLYYPGSLHKISSQSVHNFLSNVVNRQTDKQINQRYQKHNLLCQGGNNINIARPLSNQLFCFMWHRDLTWVAFVPHVSFSLPLCLTFTNTDMFTVGFHVGQMGRKPKHCKVIAQCEWIFVTAFWHLCVWEVDKNIHCICDGCGYKATGFSAHTCCVHNHIAARCVYITFINYWLINKQLSFLASSVGFSF